MQILCFALYCIYWGLRYYFVLLSLHHLAYGWYFAVWSQMILKSPLMQRRTCLVDEKTTRKSIVFQQASTLPYATKMSTGKVRLIGKEIYTYVYSCCLKKSKRKNTEYDLSYEPNSVSTYTVRILLCSVK